MKGSELFSTAGGQRFRIFQGATGILLAIILLLTACGCRSGTPTRLPTSTKVRASTTSPPAPSPQPTPAVEDLSDPASRAFGGVLLSSSMGDLPIPSSANQQTATLILDVDLDGTNDFVIATRGKGPSMVWYRRGTDGWAKHLIEAETLNIEAGGAAWDIDRDGDLDLVMGGDSKSNRVWWWENPHPDHEPDLPWTRRLIKDSGSNKHHDQIFGDFDGDGQAELVFWNQGDQRLLLAEIPPEAKGTQPWPYDEIFAWEKGKHEGLARADMDGDGQMDIVGGGGWFKRDGETGYVRYPIDDNQTFSRVAVGQLREGGRPEVVLVPGDRVGRLQWYEWTGDTWLGHDLLGFDVDHGHSLQVSDVDGDGHLDIFCAEMRLNGENNQAKMWFFFGDGQGNFATVVFAEGYGNHESKLGDLDGDGDLDILGKPYNWDTPRVDVWLSEPSGSLDHWQRHVIDAEKPWRSLFVAAVDLDNDGRQDIVTGGWWYQNPGTVSEPWTRREIGPPLMNMAAVYDFDGDSHVDILGTQGKASKSNPAFVWGRNDGSGHFEILDNVEPGMGDFLQGVAVEQFVSGGPLQVALSWHEAGKGVQRLTVPDEPAAQTWSLDMISATSQDEGLSAGDIDGDGDSDLLLGTMWLQNNPDSWTAHTLHPTESPPDRNLLADLNGDGRLDAVVGYEAISKPGKLAWYAQGESASANWEEHIIGSPVGPMSLDVADMDGDGDLDVVAGEHNKADPSQARLYVFENVDGVGNRWSDHLVYTGDEHHGGSQVVDIDGDGDLDILSIGWTHAGLLLYENKSIP